MDAKEPESEDSGFEKPIGDAGDDAEVQIGDLALAVAPAKLFSANPKIAKGKGNGKWQQRQCKKKEGAYVTGSLRFFPGLAGTSAWLVRGRAHVLRYVIPQEQVPTQA